MRLPCYSYQINHGLFGKKLIYELKTIYLLSLKTITPYEWVSSHIRHS